MEFGVGWKMNGLIVEGSVDPARLPGRPRDASETVDVDTVYERPCDYGMAVVGGWTFIADPQFRVSFNDDAVQEISDRGRALAWVTNSASTVHGFAWYVDGAPLRRIVFAEGEVVDESGERIPEEDSAPEPLSEDYVFEMMVRLTGQGWSDGGEALYRVWTCAE
ncbi:hypothetical protein GFY24_34070 [Nocardia sp. SYP-A9097]|uniref:DUF6461 domain-containing protein n=1 Tax=Nocardia sp. SYP-A9097 TaxID=2663237 RepID=UPI00129AB62C|nr:DUF6461 domain-containing protein [Nocardia sp. SYP-A9097]MRH92394.1 hypothetical protein [Nocardia sp. SYP-A9097]